MLILVLVVQDVGGRKEQTEDTSYTTRYQVLLHNTGINSTFFVHEFVFLTSSASGRPAVAILGALQCLPNPGVVGVGGSRKLSTAVVVAETATVSSTDNTSGRLMMHHTWRCAAKVSL